MAAPHKDSRPRTVVRAQHDAEHRYFILSRVTAQDPDLPLEALGLLTFLLSRPDTWQPNERELAASRKCSREKIARILRLLIARGYCLRVQVLGSPRAAGGRLNTMEYTLFEEKQQKTEVSPWTGFQAAGIQAAGNQAVEITDGETTEERGAPVHTGAPQLSLLSVSSGGEEAPDPYPSMLAAREAAGLHGKFNESQEDRGELVRLGNSMGIPEVVKRYDAFLHERVLKRWQLNTQWFIQNVDLYGPVKTVRKVTPAPAPPDPSELATPDEVRAAFGAWGVAHV